MEVFQSVWEKGKIKEEKNNSFYSIAIIWGCLLDILQLLSETALNSPA